MLENINILEFFEKWNDAVSIGDLKQIVKLYARDAILLPTMSSKIRRGHEEIEDYFRYFFSKKPVGKILKSYVKIYGEIATNSGEYQFSFVNDSKVFARFTFIYRCQEGKFQIVEHHSSQVPGG